MIRSRLLVSFLLILLASSTVFGADWPTWRHDANRTASTDEQLPAELHLQWRLDYPQLKPAWPEDARLIFDANYEPIVVGETLYVSSGASDSVTAINTDTGKERWQYFASGPVRFAPVVWQDKLYFGSDDGHVYCLDAASGELQWNFNAAPSDRLVVGNERLISVWPVRGAPTIADGKLYFTAGVWPFEGTMLYALDAESGAELHSSVLANQSPQGHLVATKDKLLIPCGRSKVYGLDRATYKPVTLKYDSRGLTDYHVIATDDFLFHGEAIFELAKKKTTNLSVVRPVVSGGVITPLRKASCEPTTLPIRWMSARIITCRNTNERGGCRIGGKRPLAADFVSSCIKSTEGQSRHLRLPTQTPLPRHLWKRNRRPHRFYFGHVGQRDAI